MSTEPGWDGILDPGETILWQGRPDGALKVTGPNALKALGSLGIIVFVLFMFSDPGDGFPSLFFGILFAVAIGQAAYSLFGDTFRRRHTWYTLTTSRAFIASKMPILSKSLKSYPIESDTNIELVRADLDSIYFATETRSGSNRSYTIKVGFERIADSKDVYAKMRDIQNRGDVANG